MPDIKLSESPLDLGQAGRDELIDGSSAVAPQSDLQLAKLEPPKSRRSDSASRELEEQSAVLSAEGLKQLTAQKPH